MTFNTNYDKNINWSKRNMILSLADCSVNGRVCDNHSDWLY